MCHHFHIQNMASFYIYGGHRTVPHRTARKGSKSTFLPGTINRNTTMLSQSASCFLLYVSNAASCITVSATSFTVKSSVLLGTGISLIFASDIVS